MPDKSGRFTTKEREFAKAYGKTGDLKLSAVAAGYPFPVQAGHRLAANPEVQELARQESRKLLMTEGAEVGVRTLIEIAADRGQSAGARVRAATELVKHSGIGAGEGNDAKEPHEMTAAELAQAINMMEGLAAARAKPVEPGLLD